MTYSKNNSAPISHFKALKHVQFIYLEAEYKKKQILYFNVSTFYFAYVNI